MPLVTGVCEMERSWMTAYRNRVHVKPWIFQIFPTQSGGSWRAEALSGGRPPALKTAPTLTRATQNPAARTVMERQRLRAGSQR